MELIDTVVQAVVKGRFTTQQVLIAVVVVVAVVVGVKLLKGIMKTVSIVGGIILLAIYFGLATPTQIKSLATETVGGAYEKYRAVSQSIEKDGDEVYIKLGGERIPLSKVVSYKETLDGKVQLLTSEGTYTSEDEGLLKFLGEISDKKD